MQKILRLALSRLPGESGSSLSLRTHTLNHQSRHVDLQKQFADLLKRQARTVITDITECPPVTINAHLARLDDLQGIIAKAVAAFYRESTEASLSGAQLQYPATLADWIAVLQLTRQQHRAPAFINNRDEALAIINHKLDLIAGLLARMEPELETEEA